MNPPTPTKNINMSIMHAQLKKRVAIGYRLTAIKFLKSFKSLS